MQLPCSRTILFPFLRHKYFFVLFWLGWGPLLLLFAFLLSSRLSSKSSSLISSSHFFISFLLSRLPSSFSSLPSASSSSPSLFFSFPKFLHSPSSSILLHFFAFLLLFIPLSPVLSTGVLFFIFIITFFLPC